MSSKVYCLAPPQDPLAILNGSFVGSVDFGTDENGEYGDITFRVPVKVLKKLIIRPSRSLDITSAEVVSLLRAIVSNESESPELRAASAKVLGRR
jgi:hypothetical protein